MAANKILAQAVVPTTIGTIPMTDPSGAAVTGGPTIAGFTLVNHTSAAIAVGAGLALAAATDTNAQLLLPVGFSLPPYGTQEFQILAGNGVELAASDLFRAAAGASGVTIQIFGRY